MTEARLPCILALLFLVCAAAASASAPVLRADMSATSLEASDSYQLTAPLAAWIQNGTATDCAANASFTLQADSLRLENDVANVSVHPASQRPFYTHEPRTESDEHGISLMEGIDNRAGCSWVLLPLAGSSLPHIEFAGSCMMVQASDVQQYDAAPRVNFNRKHVVVDVAATLRWHECQEETVASLTGDFRLALWAWNFTLTEQGQTKTVVTGSSQSPLLPSQAPALVARDQESYLFVTNGTLTTALRGPSKIYLAGESQLLAAQLHLEGATGRLDLQGTRTDLQGSIVKVTGQTQAILSGTGTSKPFTAQLAGSPDGVRVDGQVLSVTTTPTASKIPWWTLFGLVAVPAAIAVPLLRRRRSVRPGRVQGLVQQSEDLLAQQEYAAADAVTHKILDLDPTSGEAHWLRARALAGREEHAQAMQHHDQADKLLRRLARLSLDLVGENAFHAALACLHARAPDIAQARKWLNEALHAKPSLRIDMEWHPELGTLGPEPVDPDLP